MRLSDLAQWLQLPDPAVDVAITGASIDTRKLEPGQLFVALPGEHVDGHDFVRKAAALGASAALVARRQDIDFPQLVVPNVLEALQQLASQWRQAWGGRVVGVTGSNGKTSVKTLLASLLRTRYRVFVTPGNLNNHIGLPLCLLNISADDEIAVLEMGANHPGEIAELAALARPDVAVVTKAAPAHLEGFGSVDVVAQTKGALFSALTADGVAVINADDRYRDLWVSMAGSAAPLLFGRSADAQVRAESERNASLQQVFELVLGAQRALVTLPLAGRHSVMNALAAAAAASALGVPLADIVAALQTAEGVPGRLALRRATSGAAIIDDTYNANPDSLRAAVDVLASCAAPRHFVMGDMAELGADAAGMHAEAGQAIAAAGIEYFWACGPLSRKAAEAFGPEARHYVSRDELVNDLSAAIGAADSVLIKGSRSAGMDQVVAQLCEEAA